MAAAWLAFMGLAIGSFLNVVIYRLPRDLSVVSPRSRCPNCGHQLPWYENIPVFSWVALRGRCSQCKTPISPRYAIVELLTAALFMGCLARFGWTWQLLSALTFVTLLVPLTFIDAELWILPFELTLPGIALGVGLMAPYGWPAVRAAAIAVVVCFSLFRLLEWLGWWALRKEAIGAGDKFLLAMVGAFLGWRPLLGLLVLTSTQAAIFGILNLLIRGKAGPDSRPLDESDKERARRELAASPSEPGPDGAQLSEAQTATESAASNTAASNPAATNPAASNPAASNPAASNAAASSAAASNAAASSAAASNAAASNTSASNAAANNPAASNPAANNAAASNAGESSATIQGETTRTASDVTTRPAATQTATDVGATASTTATGSAADPLAVEDPEPTFTADFLKPGLPVWKRAVLLPWTVFLQPIPDDPPEDAAGEVPEWVPETTALPLGPWIALAAIEVMLAGPYLVTLFGPGAMGLSARLMFG